MSRRANVVRSNVANTSASQAHVNTEIVFSLSGAVTLTTSPPWVRRSNGALVEVIALLGGAGTGPTSVAINRSGAVIHTVTIAAGQKRQVDRVHVPFAGLTDVLTDTVTAVGSGAVDLTIIHGFG